MNRLAILAGGIVTTALLYTASIGNVPGIASAMANEEAEQERITVVAPRFTREAVRRGGGRFVHQETVERNALVDYADLDLTRSADVFLLEQRIEEAAKNLCEELEESYPHGRPDKDVCIQRAIQDGMEDARLAIADANTP